jgi:hypothetical protein
MPEPPPVLDLSPTGSTPVLGTVLAPSIVAEEPRLSVAELAEALATPVPPDDEIDIDIDIEVPLSEMERTMVPEDLELILLAEDGAELERTEPCSSPPLESVLPPEVAVASDLELPDDVLASAPDASPPVAEVPESETVLPPWVTARPVQAELSPPTRVRVTRRESNVEDLLERMPRESVDVDDVRSGLKSLAGLEPTPPPPGPFTRH